jgi:hypothetical protein
MYVINGVSQNAYVGWYIDCNNMHDMSKGTGKVHPRTGHEGQEGEQMYSCTLSLTSPGGVGGQRHAPAPLPPGHTR